MRNHIYKYELNKKVLNCISMNVCTNKCIKIHCNHYMAMIIHKLDSEHNIEQATSFILLNKQQS